jgi:hypothetical protein
VVFLLNNLRTADLGEYATTTADKWIYTTSAAADRGIYTATTAADKWIYTTTVAADRDIHRHRRR